MQVPSGLPLPADNVPLALFSDQGRWAEPCHVEDEEFPADSPVRYDWMLQPASQVNSQRFKRLIALTVAALLIAVSVFMVDKVSDPSPFVLASPSVSLH